MEKQILNTADFGPEKLPVMEHFYTIQGEGHYTGHAAYFVRLAGCDVGCVFCDVKESWGIDEHPVLSLDEIVEEIGAANLVVVTGGEPSLYPLQNLTSRLKEKGIRTHMETSGSHEITGVWDWICLSPKKRKMPVDSSWKKAHELKVVISRKNDFAFAEKCASEVSADCICFLQPEWDKEKKILPEIIDYIKDNPKWKMSLQTHKYMDIP